MSVFSRLRRGPRPKRMRASDATKMFDAIFVGLAAPHQGKVFAFANPAGRAAIGKVVPNFDIAWQALSGDAAIGDQLLEYGRCIRWPSGSEARIGLRFHNWPHATTYRHHRAHDFGLLHIVQILARTLTSSLLQRS